MFWDRVSGVYDLFVNVYNRKVHRRICETVHGMIASSDTVLECACGTGMLTVGIAQRCHHLVATDYSEKMLARTQHKCRGLSNITFRRANILSLKEPIACFEKVVAANVLHLLDEPLKALAELNRVCKPGGMIILPTYMNKEKKGKTSTFSRTVGKAGANFKRQFTAETYQQFLKDAGFPPASCTVIKGRVPCAVAMIVKRGGENNAG